jgi:hypothetical protein
MLPAAHCLPPWCYMQDKKAKLQLAMGDIVKEDAPMSDQERRQRMISAVHGDDWSAVIDRQSQEAVGAIPDVPAASSTEGPMASPFTRATVHRSIGADKVCLRAVTQAAGVP